MNRLIAITLAALLAGACSGNIKTNDDAEDDVITDTTVDATDVSGEGACTPGEGEECLDDGDTLRRCNSDGSGFELVACPVGCVSDPDPHCTEWSISNIPDMDMLFSGEAREEHWAGPAIDIPGDHWIGFNTENGRISIYVAEPTPWEVAVEVRDAVFGLDAATGIAFEFQTQPDGASRMGVFSFQKFDIPANFTIGVVGPYPLVIMSEEDSVIEGGVKASCIWDVGPTYADAGDSGEEDGAGAQGTGSGADYGGGGGGGYGGTGGAGSGVGSLGGAGGTTYGTSELIPLHGGAGGGYSGGPEGDAARGSRGGRSGGAVEIVSGGTLTIAATGWVDASGCGGFPSYDGTNPFGGGGGGSGGSILLEAPIVEIQGNLSVNGGAGAAGGYLGDTDAEEWSMYGDRGNAGSDTAAGGGTSTGADNCNGGDGNGGGGDTGSGAPDCSTAFGGGGGGGCGRIRINGQSVSITGTLSPAETSDAVTQGPLVLP
ncbi:MAG: hypothetical protein JRG91_15005 [Deltaproteobacteria bacterium]|nr:hypothetical protein [Deltaproteobacteria bacterium]